jgi:hypothetical protein
VDKFKVENFLDNNVNEILGVKIWVIQWK